MKSILVATAEQKLIQTLRSCFPLNHDLNQASSKNQAVELLSQKRYELIFIDLDILLEKIPPDNYKEALQPFRQIYPTIEIVVMAPQGQIRKAVRTVKAGASGYLSYPIDPEEVKHVAEGITESIIKRSELNYLRDQFWRADSLELVQTKSPVMKTVFEKIRSVSPTKSNVLLIGETGTGKSVLAKLIHQHSNRRNSQFISIHCGAIPDTLVESELFGHEKGAFTGAIKRKLGRFEIARGGTIFLDEIGTITPSAQVKLLQVLQDGTFQRVGGEETLETDVRVIAATNADLKKMCDDGKFRKDLYYRLSVFPITIPPLRERIDDIPLLVWNFIRQFEKRMGKHIQSVPKRSMEALQRYPWAGNARELRNVIEHAMIVSSGKTLVLNPPTLAAPKRSAEMKSLQEVERQHILSVLKETGWRVAGKNGAAKILGLKPTTLEARMKKLGINRPTL